MQIKWSKEEDEFLIENYPHITKEQILEKINRSWGAIVKHANETLHIVRNGIFSQANVLKLLEETPIAYYYVGFLLADGHFNNLNGSNDLKLVLAEEDRQNLENFAKYVEFKKETRLYSKAEKREIVGNLCNAQDSYVVNFSDQINKPVLMKKFDISHIKTYVPPNLTWIREQNPDLYFCLWIGFIDGDGSISYNMNPDRSFRESCHIAINCHKSWENNFIEFEDFIYNYSNIKKHKRRKDPELNKRKNASLQLADMNLLIKIKQKIIDFGLYNVVMSRKWAIIKMDYEVERSRKTNFTIKTTTDMLKQGKNLKDISKLIGLTEDSITQIVNRENLHT